MTDIPTITEPQPMRTLTRREAEVLGYVAQGMTDKEIGERLFVTHRTVNYHLVNAYDKLGVNNRIRAVLVARRAGILQ